MQVNECNVLIMFILLVKFLYKFYIWKWFIYLFFLSYKLKFNLFWFIFSLQCNVQSLLVCYGYSLSLGTKIHESLLGNLVLFNLSLNCPYFQYTLYKFAITFNIFKGEVISLFATPPRATLTRGVRYAAVCYTSLQKIVNNIENGNFLEVINLKNECYRLVFSTLVDKIHIAMHQM